MGISPIDLEKVEANFPFPRVRIMAVQTIGAEKVVHLFGKLANFRQSSGKTQKKRQSQRVNLHLAEELEEVVVHVARRFHETLLPDAHGFHDGEEKVTEQRSCLRLVPAIDRMMSSVPVTAPGE